MLVLLCLFCSCALVLCGFCHWRLSAVCLFHSFQTESGQTGSSQKGCNFPLVNLHGKTCAKCGNMLQNMVTCDKILQNVATCAHLNQYMTTCRGFVALLWKPRLSRRRPQAGELAHCETATPTWSDAQGPKRPKRRQHSSGNSTQRILSLSQIGSRCEQWPWSAYTCTNVNKQ